MESIEFLGGKYNRLEQITVGATQAFRAQNAATGRSVFIHRVSTTEAPAEQATLLKLLTTALVKSSDAKRLVLDFGEDSGFWYVVTESEPQCALLRDWLQLQVDAVASSSKPSGAPSVGLTEDKKPVEPVLRPAQRSAPAPPVIRSIAPTSEPSAGTLSGIKVPSKNPTAEPIQAASEQTPLGDFTRIFSPAVTSSTSLPEEQNARPGEFTSFFSQSKPQKEAPPPPESKPESPPASPHEHPEPGEFTRFFSPGLQSSAPKPPAPATPALNVPQRPANSPQVQRPPRANTVIPPSTPPVPPVITPQGTGEFTKFFSGPTNLSRDATARSEGLLSDKIEIPQAPPPSTPPEGDFTRMFGTAGPASPGPLAPAVVAQARPKSLIDEHLPLNTQPIQAVSATPKPTLDEAPSEFTRVARGGYASPKPPAPNPPLPQAKVSAVAPKAAVPPPQATIPTGAKSNKNLVIFLAVVAVLAVLLILAVLFLMKK